MCRIQTTSFIMSEFVFMSRRHKRFRDKLGEIIDLEDKTGTSSCTREINGKIVGVNVDYIREVILPRTQYLFWYQTLTEGRGRHGRPLQYYRIDGFLLAHVKTIRGQRVFYIDLVCSKHKKGATLLRDAEEFAKDQGHTLVALRAAMPRLISYYRTKGYRRVNDACRNKSRKGRKILREIDENAILEFRGRKIKLGEGWWMSKCL